MESYPPEIEEQLVAEFGDGMAEIMGRHDFLNKGKTRFGSIRRCATVGFD